MISGGDFIGWFCYSSPTHYTMELNLSIKGSQLSGRGMDCIGGFNLTGTLNGDSCTWTKTYIGRHSVFYEGCVDENRLYGTWFTDYGNSGGFMLWPRKGNGLKKGNEATEEIQDPFPVIVMQPIRIPILTKPS